MLQQIGVTITHRAAPQALRQYSYQDLPGIESIAAIYLFGSFVQGTMREQSDIDLAFLLPEPVYKADPFAALGTATLLAARLGKQFGRETDLTILNAASIEIAYEIVTTGYCAYASDIGIRLEYEAMIRGMYYDFQPFLKELRSNCIARL